MIKFVRNQETISGQIDTDLVMMDIAKGSYFSLNSVASRIWEMLAEPLAVDNLCDLLMQEYDVSPAQCHADVEEHLAAMQQLGLVKKIT